jgi:hypothetical protein
MWQTGSRPNQSLQVMPKPLRAFAPLNSGVSANFQLLLSLEGFETLKFFSIVFVVLNKIR